jgi:hypothetical protein
MGVLKVAVPKKDHRLTVNNNIRRMHILNYIPKTLKGNNVDGYCKCFANESLPNDKYDIVNMTYQAVFSNEILCHNCKRQYNERWGLYATS